MFGKFLSLCSVCCFIYLSGCAGDAGSRPGISYDYNPYERDVGAGDVKVATSEPQVPSTPAYPRVPASWIPPRHLERRWTAIVLHHSATSSGNAALFDKSHREGNGWDGVGYDFVIGNGRGSGDGEVEVTFRWREQRTGAHCKTGSSNWANREGIGICVVGNFEKTFVSPRQMQSLVKLVGYLQGRYNIPTSRIYGHNTVPGARATRCPGKYFPMSRLKRILSERQ